MPRAHRDSDVPIPFAAVIMDNVPYFSDLKASTPPPYAPALKTARSKVVYWITYLVNLAIPGLLVIPVMFVWVGKNLLPQAPLMLGLVKAILQNSVSGHLSLEYVCSLFSFSAII